MAPSAKLRIIEESPRSVSDFAHPARPIEMAFVGGRGHYEQIIQSISRAQRCVWIATANVKELMVEGPRRSVRTRSRYRSVLAELNELAARGVELRLLHAGDPSRPFRRSFDRYPRLIRGGLELRQCPRVHFKTVIVDAESCYLGSANWTGAGLGAKASGRRNFELGFITRDELLIDEVQAMYEAVWSGSQCSACTLREQGCPAPLDL